jgi:hypothetical protein
LYETTHATSNETGRTRNAAFTIGKSSACGGAQRTCEFANNLSSYELIRRTRGVSVFQTALPTVELKTDVSA